jgi:hypothetical protein
MAEAFSAPCFQFGTELISLGLTGRLASNRIRANDASHPESADPCPSANCNTADSRGNLPGGDDKPG